MADVTLTIPDLHFPEVRSALAKVAGYEPNPSDPLSGEPIAPVYPSEAVAAKAGLVILVKQAVLHERERTRRQTFAAQKDDDVLEVENIDIV